MLTTGPPVAAPTGPFEWMTLHAPSTRPLEHVMLEVVVLTCAIAGLVHALRARRAGDLTPLFTWVVTFVYGLAMELISYNFIKSFTHAQFTVMFYGKQLPLYVCAIYPCMLYVGIMVARRLGIRPALEGFAAGLVIVSIDMPFDILGPVVNWWSWSDTDPTVAARWLDVPVSSYYWHLAFGGILASLTSVIGPRLRRLPSLLALSAPVSAAVIAAGVVSFLPYHALAALGVPQQVIVAAALALGLGITLSARRRPPETPDHLLLAIPALFYAFHLVVAFCFAPLPKLVTILAVTGFAAAVNVVVHRARQPG